MTADIDVNWLYSLLSRSVRACMKNSFLTLSSLERKIPKLCILVELFHDYSSIKLHQSNIKSCDYEIAKLQHPEHHGNHKNPHILWHITYQSHRKCESLYFGNFIRQTSDHLQVHDLAIHVTEMCIITSICVHVVFSIIHRLHKIFHLWTILLWTFLHVTLFGRWCAREAAYHVKL